MRGQGLRDRPLRRRRPHARADREPADPGVLPGAGVQAHPRVLRRRHPPRRRDLPQRRLQPGQPEQRRRRVQTGVPRGQAGRVDGGEGPPGRHRRQRARRLQPQRGRGVAGGAAHPRGQGVRARPAAQGRVEPHFRQHPARHRPARHEGGDRRLHRGRAAPAGAARQVRPGELRGAQAGAVRRDAPHDGGGDRQDSRGALLGRGPRVLRRAPSRQQVHHPRGHRRARPVDPVRLLAHRSADQRLRERHVHLQRVGHHPHAAADGEPGHPPQRGHGAAHRDRDPGRHDPQRRLSQGDHLRQPPVPAERRRDPARARPGDARPRHRRVEQPAVLAHHRHRSAEGRDLRRHRLHGPQGRLGRAPRHRRLRPHRHDRRLRRRARPGLRDVRAADAPPGAAGWASRRSSKSARRTPSSSPSATATSSPRSGCSAAARAR